MDGRGPGRQGFLHGLWHSQTSLNEGKWLGSEDERGSESRGSKAKNRRQRQCVARKCQGHRWTAGGWKVPPDGFMMGTWCPGVRQRAWPAPNISQSPEGVAMRGEEDEAHLAGNQRSRENVKAELPSPCNSLGHLATG